MRAVERLDGMTLGDIKNAALLSGDSTLLQAIKRSYAVTYPDFIEVLYEDVDSILSVMQENPELLLDDGEDRLTINIIGSLKVMGYEAYHEPKIGGHTDLSVRSKRAHLWLGEAKVHSSYQHLFDGFQQLTTRYSTGDVNQDEGGMIIYIRNMNSAQVMTRWREDLAERGVDGIKFFDSPIRPDHVFYTSHLHERSSRNYTVRHMGVILGFNPKDQGTKTAI